MMSLFFGSVTLAYAIQNVNLHRRIALFVLNLVGSSIKWYCQYSIKHFKINSIFTG